MAKIIEDDFLVNENSKRRREKKEAREPSREELLSLNHSATVHREYDSIQAYDK